MGCCSCAACKCCVLVASCWLLASCIACVLRVCCGFTVVAPGVCVLPFGLLGCCCVILLPGWSWC